jgi:hypothetical protein
VHAKKPGKIRTSDVAVVSDNEIPAQFSDDDDDDLNTISLKTYVQPYFNGGVDNFLGPERTADDREKSTPRYRRMSNYADEEPIQTRMSGNTEEDPRHRTMPENSDEGPIHMNFPWAI